MFPRLAASLNFVFKWFSIFDLDRTFLSNILRYEQMSDRSATANKACASGKKEPIKNRNCVTSQPTRHTLKKM